MIYAFAGAAYFAMAVRAIIEMPRRATGISIVIALCLTGGYHLLGAAIGMHRLVDPGVVFLLDFLDSARIAAWGCFLALLATTSRSGRSRPWHLLFIAVLFLVGIPFSGSIATPVDDSRMLVFALDRLMLASMSLFLLEELLRKSTVDGRRQLKHVGMALASVMIVEVLVWSETLMLRRVENWLDATRGVVSLAAAPLFALAIVRNKSWSIDLYVSRKAAFGSITLVAVGVYVVSLAGAGLFATRLHVVWGPIVQIGVFVAGMLLLGIVLGSERVRSLVQLWISRNLYRATYDYRREWRSFLEAMSRSSKASLKQRILRAVARPLDVTSAGLWMRNGDAFVKEEEIGLGHDWPLEIPAVSVTAFLEEGIPIDLSRLGADVRHHLIHEIGVDARILVPLAQRSRAIGFMLLEEPRITRPIETEELDLISMMSAQATSYLAEDEAFVLLEEERRFAEVSRRLAFTAHDLRNLANELQLALSNARRHLDRPEFGRDLVQTMEECVASMQRLLDRVGRAERGDLAPKSSEADSHLKRLDLLELVKQSPYVQLSSGPVVEVEFEDDDLGYAVEGDRDEFAAMIGHLLRNAIEAVSSEGHVHVSLRREKGDIVLEVEDDGPGMPMDVHRAIAHPFRSSRQDGFGLGLYECRRLAEASGGVLEIDRERRAGASVRVRIPERLGSQREAW